MSVFSQQLSRQEQSDFLVTADNFFSGKGVKFIYPVHGGFLGSGASVLAYGNAAWYDSMAPEFQTYAPIKELAQAK